MRIKKILIITFIISLFLVLFPVTASTQGIESFESYPTGSFPLDNSYSYNLRYWLPVVADDPVIEIVEDPEYVYHGNKSVKMTIDGRGDDGTVWLLSTIPSGALGEPSSNHTLTISGWLYSSIASDVNQWPVMASISTQEPISNATKQEEDFTIIGWTEVKAGWTDYSLEISNFALPNNENEAIFFTFGISVRWETVRTYWIDYLIIQVDGAVYQMPITTTSSSDQQIGLSPGFEVFIIVLALMSFWLLRKSKRLCLGKS